MHLAIAPSVAETGALTAEMHAAKTAPYSRQAFARKLERPGMRGACMLRQPLSLA